MLNLFDAFASNPFDRDPFFRLLRTVDGPGARSAARGEGSFFDPAPVHARVHADETDDATTLVIDLPDVEDDGVELEVTEDTVTVRATSEPDAPEGYEALRRERRPRAVAKTLRLGHRVDVDAVGADLTDGVLTITLPRAQPARRTIPINVAPGD